MQICPSNEFKIIYILFLYLVSSCRLCSLTRWLDLDITGTFHYETSNLERQFYKPKIYLSWTVSMYHVDQTHVNNELTICCVFEIILLVHLLSNLMVCLILCYTSSKNILYFF